MRKLQQEQYSVVFVTETVYQMASKVIEEHNRSFLPAITVLPAFGEQEQLGAERLNGLIEKGLWGAGNSRK